MPNKKISQLSDAAALTGGEHLEILQGGVNLKTTSQDIADLAGLGITSEFHRTFSETIIFDKNEIFYDAHVATSNLNYEIGSSGLIDKSSTARQIITVDGSQSINFGSGFEFLYGITNGEVLDAGTYEIYFLYTNGSVSVNFPGTSVGGSSATVLAVPTNFAATPDATNPETELDLSWTDVANESSYLIEVSLTGTGGWSTLDTPAANATTSTQTGLSAGDTRYYRIKAIGDGVTFLDSSYSSVISGQTEDLGDVSAPTFTFLPASGNTTWTVNKPITLTANEPIRNTDGSEITSANVATRLTLKETNSGGADIGFTATIDATKTIITITPTSMYGANQLVYVAINNVEDVNGNEVTVAISSTFTTTEYTFFNGTSNRLMFGDILDTTVFAVDNAEFWLELTINNLVSSGNGPLVGKGNQSTNERGFKWWHNGTDVYFGWYSQGTSVQLRLIKWTGALTSTEHVLVFKYDGSIDTNDGLDRVTLLVDGGTAGSKTLEIATINPLGNIYNNTAQLVVGNLTSGGGTPVVGEGFLGGEAKDFIIRTSAGSVIEINVPILRIGADTSGNSRNGTWG